MLSVDAASPVPPYEQVRAQVAAQVLSGELAPEDKMPTVRALATGLGLSPGTVARAYRELEASGTVVTRGRHGTFVAASSDAAVREAGAAARTFAATARRLGIPPAEAVDLVRTALAAGGSPAAQASEAAPGSPPTAPGSPPG